MSKLRTYEEKEAILRHCLELEKSGGDILGYLWEQDYLTPRATWFNYQREWLGRKPYQYTDGKPKKKGVNNMGKPVNTNEDRQRRLYELIERINRGMGIRAALADMGYTGKSAGQQYRQLRNFAKENDPVAYAALPEKMDGSVVPVTSLADAMKNCQDAAETFFGECEKMGLTVDKPDVTVKPKICKPVNYDGFEMITIRSAETGNKFEWSAEYKLFTIKSHGDEMTLHIDDFKALLKEIQRAAAVLGVEL